MGKGIRFYNVVWTTPTEGLHQTIEAETTRKRLQNKIREGRIEYFFGERQEKGTVVKVQDIETPMIEIEWLLKLFTTAGTKEERETHRDQAAYVLRLVEMFAARVHLENGDYIER